MKSHTTLQVATPAALGSVTAEEAELLAKLDLARLPRHVAVIMDGNGRWAQRKHLPRVAGSPRRHADGALDHRDVRAAEDRSADAVRVFGRRTGGARRRKPTF